VGMVARFDQTSEGIFQHLTRALAKGRCYSFLIQLARGTEYDGYTNPITLEIWGGNHGCDRQELLWHSPAIHHTNWVSYEVNLSPHMNYDYLIFFVTGYGGNILIDDITQEKIITLPKEFTADDFICEGQTLTLNAFSPEVTAYTWNTGEKSSDIVIHQGGSYSVTLVAGACSTTISKEIVFQKKPSVVLGHDTTLYFGTVSYPVMATVTPVDAHVQWSTGEDSYNIEVNQSDTYWVSAFNECGVSSDTIRIGFSPLFIPNVITVNDDDLNDVFYILGIEPGQWDLTIINRWGEVIYHDSAYKNTWPAAEVTAGVYYYLLRNKNSLYEFRNAIHVITD
jgi:hypothetical protein